MKVHYFIHTTGTDTGISGVPRVVKSLGRELLSRDDVELVPSCWSLRLETLVHAEQKLLDNLARHDGPALRESGHAREPVAAGAGDWLLIAEVPHLHSYDPDYPSVSIDEPIGWARRQGLKVAAVLHDIMPLTFELGSERRRAFADLVPGAPDEATRLKFAVYAHALAQADLVIPVSRTSGELLAKWLVGHGHDEGALPPIFPTLLPEEVLGVERAIPHSIVRDESETKEFLTVGTVCTHKNQLATMSAFQRLVERRPELNVRLNVVGTVSPESAAPTSLIAKRAKGRIILHGRVEDARMPALTRGAYATVFVSLAEGYGLPVAESLWHGKPCICSNEGSIAEIAANGGCVAVDPQDPDEIESAIELLATNTDRYNEILQQVAFRRLKSWQGYAGSIVDLLQTYSADGPAAVKLRLREQQEARPSFGEPVPSKARRSAVLTFSASEFNVHDAYARRSRPLRHAGAIRYDRALDGEVQQDVLFYGPYVWLPAGRYSFAFDGEIEGELALSFMADTGAEKIAKVSLRSFDEPVVIEFPRSMNKFEIVGSRTPSLERMVLRYVLVGYRAFPQASLGEQETDEPPEPPVREPVYAHDDQGRPIGLPFTIAATAMAVDDAFGAGAANRLRANSTIAFKAEDHGDVDAALFYGPYLRLEPGDYRFRFQGELDGALRLRLTRDYATECLLETVLIDFQQPVRLRLEQPAENFEIIGNRTDSTRSMVLRKIEVERQELGEHRASDGMADAGGGPGHPIAMRTDDGRELALPLVWLASAMRVHDAFGEGEANRLRAGDSIAFDAKAHGAVEEQVVFFGPYFHLEPGDYSFRFRGALKGSMGLRFSKNFGEETLFEVEVDSFDDPVRVKIESPADKVEIIGRRLPATRAMTLSAIEIAAVELATKGDQNEGAERRRGRILARLFSSHAEKVRTG
jgi:glycosyltransferase involved in cell wall biosynthesis